MRGGRARPRLFALALVFAGTLILEAAAVETAAPPGALSCSGCHAARPGGPDGLPRLAGRPAAETAAALAAFRSGERPATLMGRIAKGFTEEESRAIALWLEGQP